MAKVFFASMSADQGRASVDLRVVLGALLVKHVEGISDEDTIQYIQENIYAQYFVGLPSFQTAPVFVPHLFVEIRKRLGKQGAQRLNDEVLRQALRLKAIKHRAKPRKKNEPGAGDEDGTADDPENSATGAETEVTSEEKGTQTDQGAESSQARNRGTLKLDATVAPQHVGYPTDTRLLHEGRLFSEELIDKLYYGSSLWGSKPRTYRRLAHKQYLAFSKKRNPGKRAIKRTRGQQLKGYRTIYGYYPEVVLVDRVYLNHENRKFLKAKGIRHSGKPLGRPPELSHHEKQKRRKEQNKRSEIEGKFGQGKSKYGLDDIQTRRADTSYACIGLILLALNAIKLGGAFFTLILSGCRRWWNQVVNEEVKFALLWAENEIIEKLSQRGALAGR